jgi:transposase
MGKGKRILFSPRQRSELKNAYERERNAFTRIRIWALLQIAKGKTASELSSQVGLGGETIRKWARKYKRYGLKGVPGKSAGGRHKRLSDKQIEQLRNWVKKGRIRTLNQAAQMIKQRFDVPYTKSGISRLFRSLGIRFNPDLRCYSFTKTKDSISAQVAVARVSPQ